MAPTSKPSGAADPTEPAAAGLDAFFGAMRLGDAASVRLQTQPRPDPPQVVPVPTTRQQFEMAMQMQYYWPQPEEEPTSHAVGENNYAAAEHASLLASRGHSSFVASDFGTYSPRFNAPAAPFPSAPAAIAPFHHPSASPSSSRPSTSTNHYQPATANASQHGASLSWNHNVGVNQFAFEAMSSAMPAAGRSQDASIDPYASASLPWNHHVGHNQFASAMPSGMPAAGPSQDASIDPYASPSLGWNHNVSVDEFISLLTSAMPAGPSRNASIDPYASASHHGASLPWNHNVGLNPYASALPSSAVPAGPSQNSSIHPYASYSQPRTAAASFGQHHNASIDPYASAYYLSDLYANQVAYEPWADMPAVRRGPTLQEVRWRLLRRPTDPALLMSPQTADHVVNLLLDGGDEEVRRSVLAGVKHAVHRVMQSREGCDVFCTLLRACCQQVRFDDVRGIVDAVCRGRGVLMDILTHEHGVAALKVLIMTVAPNDQLSALLINWLVIERLAEHCKCKELVQLCFAWIPYETCSCLIRFAIRNIDELLLSVSGSMYLAECFAKARNNELRFLEEFLVEHTSRIAMGQFSNYLMQRALDYGSDALKDRIAERVAADVATLSLDKFGSYVVEACILLTTTCSLVPMQRVLLAFLQLDMDQLGELVRGGCSNYVVHRLLVAGKGPFPEDTKALAERIEALPAAVQRDMHAQGVMRVVEKMTSFSRHQHY